MENKKYDYHINLVENKTIDKPSIQTTAKIAKYLGVSIEDLIK